MSEKSSKKQGWTTWFSRRGKDGVDQQLTNMQNKSSSTTTRSGPRNTLLISWNMAALATVVLPLFMFMIARLVNRKGGQNDGNQGAEEQEGWWDRLWWWGGNEDNGADEDGPRWWWYFWWWGTGALAFVYVWSLLFFGFLVWGGNQVLGAKKEGRTLVGILVTFANLAFLCCILVGNLEVEHEANEAGRGWLDRFPAVMVLTYALWTVFAIVFAVIVHGKARRNKQTLWDSVKNSAAGDYQKYEDSGGIV